MSREEAERRLCERHSSIDAADRANARAAFGEAHAQDGRVEWKFDPMHRCVSPFPFFASMYRAFAARITCPVLAVGGGEDGFHPPDEDERMRRSVM